jgi:predicted DNA-binding transcriptional regulator YafY
MRRRLRLAIPVGRVEMETIGDPAGEVARFTGQCREQFQPGERRRLDMLYESWRKTARRSVDPLGLVLKAGEWYLVARSGKHTLIFRVAAIHEADILDQRFHRPDCDLPRLWKGLTDEFLQSLRRSTAVIRVAPQAMSLVDRLGSDMAGLLRAAAADEDGWRWATVPIESIPHAAGLLLGLGANVEVLEPPELRAELARRAAEVVALYQALR